MVLFVHTIIPRSASVPYCCVAVLFRRSPVVRLFVVDAWKIFLLTLSGLICRSCGARARCAGWFVCYCRDRASQLLCHVCWVCYPQRCLLVNCSMMRCCSSMGLGVAVPVGLAACEPLELTGEEARCRRLYDQSRNFYPSYMILWFSAISNSTVFFIASKTYSSSLLRYDPRVLCTWYGAQLTSAAAEVPSRQVTPVQPPLPTWGEAVNPSSAFARDL